MSQQSLGPYVIGTRVGTSVWLAEDTRNGKQVAIKLLSKQLPADPGRRESLIREVRVAAALYHTFLVPILEIVPIGDNLLMVMDVVEGEPVARKLRGQPLERAEFFRIAYQLASVVKYLQIKGLLHGNINGDAVMVTADGQVRLGGLNFANLLRREKTSQQYQQKGSDARCVAYMAPEQIVSQAIDAKTDVFSMGAVLYEMATGKLPFAGPTAADIARAVVAGQPPSPKTLNPNVDNAVLSILGGCLFKDPFNRFKDAKALTEAIEKLDSAAVEFAVSLEKRITTATSVSEHRRTILFIADVANYDALHAEDPERAAKAAARMQQILGEAVYLFDGKVIDPFGTRMVAELPSIENALEAGRKGEFDFSPEQTASLNDRLSVRMLLHAGEVEIRDGVPAGVTIEKGFAALSQLVPNTLFISEEFVKEGRGNVRMRDAGAKGGLKLYTIVPAETPIVAEEETELSTAELEVELAAEAEALAAQQLAAAKAKKKQRVMMAAAAAVIVLLGAASGAMWKRQRNHAPAATNVASMPALPERPTREHPRTIHLAQFTVDGGDAKLTEQANAIRLGAASILRSFPELRLAENPASDVVSFSARVTPGPAGAQIVPLAGAKSGTPVPMLDVAGGIRSVVEFVTAEVKAQPRQYASADALNSFGAALVARANHDSVGADAALRAAMQADPKFLPAQLLAMELFAINGKNEDAIAAAKQVVALDPANLDAARKVARASLIVGDLQQSFAVYQLVLDREPKDAEALNLIARYAAAVGDQARFNAALMRLRNVPPAQIEAHAPDIEAVRGRLSQAVDRYYDIEVRTSPALSLKIGRLAVLRHSAPLAEDELKKLEKSDPLYGYHLLKAYIAAENRNRDEAMKELEIALSAARPGDESWTSAAEVYAILNDTPAVLAALERAAKRKEPTAAYVLANPLFKYLESDARFATLRATLTLQQGEIQAALAQLK